MNKRLAHYRNSKYFVLSDIFIIVAVIVAIVALLLVVFLPQEGQTVEIFSDGELVKTIDLSDSTSYLINGVTVCVKDGKATVADSDCPDKLCCKANAISRAGECIICLPNRVVVRIHGKGEVDGIAQ